MSTNRCRRWRGGARTNGISHSVATLSLARHVPLTLGGPPAASRGPRPQAPPPPLRGARAPGTDNVAAQIGRSVALAPSWVRFVDNVASLLPARRPLPHI